MEKRTKKKMTAVALATAAIMILAGTMAYLADASGTIRNIFDDEHIRVQINESGITDSTTGANTDNGDKDYTVLPGTSEGKDPTITVDTDTDAYVFAVVKDTINSHTATGASEATKFVDYHIADGWTLLDEGGESSEFGPKTIKKYVDILNEKTTGDLVVNPKDPNTRIYYRIVHGSELANGDHDTDDLTDHRFTFNVLTNDQISYPSSLTNEDMNLLNGISDEEQKALIFQTWAIQMEPFCPADEVATADPATDDQKQYAKDAWNETTVVPTSVTVSQAESKTTVGIGKTLPLTATVTPKNAVDKTVTWSSSNTDIATVDENGVVTGVAEGGPVTITATATAGDNVTGTYQVTVTKPHILWQVQLHSTDNSKATFWPAAGNSYGSHCNSDNCICDATWKEIAANPSAYDACKDAGCTKTVTIDEDAEGYSNIFNTDLTGDVQSGMLYDSLQPAARVWGTPGDTTPTPTYDTTLAAMKAACDITGVAVSDFKLLTLDAVDPDHDIEGAPIVYNESGSAYYWWLATPHGSDHAYFVGNSGYVSNYGVSDGRYLGIAPGFSISAN